MVRKVMPDAHSVISFLCWALSLQAVLLAVRAARYLALSRSGTVPQGTKRYAAARAVFGTAILWATVALMLPSRFDDLAWLESLVLLLAATTCQTGHGIISILTDEVPNDIH
jgi:hypothetical protein